MSSHLSYPFEVFRLRCPTSLCRTRRQMSIVGSIFRVAFPIFFLPKAKIQTWKKSLVLGEENCARILSLGKIWQMFMIDNARKSRGHKVQSLVQIKLLNKIHTRPLSVDSVLESSFEIWFRRRHHRKVQFQRNGKAKSRSQNLGYVKEKFVYSHTSKWVWP